MNQDKLFVCNKKSLIQTNILYVNVRVQYSSVCSYINAESRRKMSYIQEVTKAVRKTH